MILHSTLIKKQKNIVATQKTLNKATLYSESKEEKEASNLQHFFHV